MISVEYVYNMFDRIGPIFALMKSPLSELVGVFDATSKKTSVLVFGRLDGQILPC